MYPQVGKLLIMDKIKEVELRIYKDLNTLRTNTVKDSVYFVFNSTTQKVSEIWVTNKSNIPKPVELATAADIKNTDGNLTITGTTINVSNALLTTVNSALQSGDDISSLINDANYITLADIPTFIPSDYDLEDFTNISADPFVHISEAEAIASNLVPYTGATQDVDLGEHQIKTSQLELDQTPTGTFSTGKIRWNDTAGTAEIKLKGNSVTLQVGQELVKRVVNKTVTNITLQESNYQSVKIIGATGQRLSVDLAQANSEINSATTIGLVTENIANNQEGFITFSGEVNSINTTGSLQGETWVDGDVLYLSPTVAGQLTKVAPTAPNHTIKVGYVQYSHITQGKIHVDVDTGYSLNNLHNVAIAGTIANKVLGSITEGLWENKTIGDILGYEPTSVDDLKIDTGANSSITTVTVGGIPSGTDIQDRTFESLLTDILIAYLYPQFQSQSCNYPSIVEVGTTVSGNGIFAWSISNAGNVKPNTVAIFDINSATNIATGLANDGSETVALNSILLNANNATQSWKIKAQNTKDENFESGNIVVTAKFKRFFGATSATPTTATARSLGSEFQVSNQFILNTGSTLTKFAVCLPSGVTISSVIDLDALNLNITSNYVSLGTININDIGGTSRVYNLYEMNIGAPYSANHRHQITTI